MSQFILSGFADEIAPELDTQIRVMKSLEISYIEMRGVNGKNLCDYSLAQAQEIKAQLDEAGVKISAIGSPIGKINITDPFEPHLKAFRHVLDLADCLETKYIRMFSFFMPKGVDPSQSRDEVLCRWQGFVDAAKGRGITLLHENEKDIYGDTPERCLDLLTSLNCEYVRATFDPANFIQCGVEVYPHAYTMLRPYIEYMHIKDAKASDGAVTVAGRGDGHIPSVLQDLKDSGYTGFLSLEPHLTNFVGFADLEESAEVAQKEDMSQGAKLFAAASASLTDILQNLKA